MCIKEGQLAPSFVCHTRDDPMVFCLTNTSRSLPLYYADMSRLEAQHPKVYQHFLQGVFAVQLGSEIAYGKIQLDQ